MCMHACMCRRLLAESALGKLELEVAEKAFVKSKDYPGIQLVKRLKRLEVSLLVTIIIYNSCSVGSRGWGGQLRELYRMY